MIIIPRKPVSYCILRGCKGLQDKGLIASYGLQSHLTMDNPSLVDVNSSLLEYGELGLELQITELDMGLKRVIQKKIFKSGKTI